MVQAHPFDRYAGFTDLAALKDFSERPLRKSIRINTLKSPVEAFKSRAQKRGWVLSSVPWCPEAFFVDREDRSVALGKDLLHLLGHTYMQEAASMLPPALLDPQPGETILDMSAAPGSKTTQIAARMQNKGVIISNDVQEKRLWTLKSSLFRAGVINTIVTKKVGQWFARHMTERFDRVLCDAPCTAQGTSRKDSDALMYCSRENIGKMARLQRELLEAAVDAAKVGGVIVYSTCTLTPEENEEVVRSILNKFSDQLEVIDPIAQFGDIEWVRQAVADAQRVQESLHPDQVPVPMLRLWPHTLDTEGFFCAGFRKCQPTRRREPMETVRFQEEEMPPARACEVGETLQARFGTSFLNDDDRLFVRTDQLLLANAEVAAMRLPVQNYSLGLPFALRLEDKRLRLSHETATLRGARASKCLCPIADEQLEALLAGKDPAYTGDLSGDVILSSEGIVVGMALAKEGKLKNRLPRWIVQKS